MKLFLTKDSNGEVTLWRSHTGRRPTLLLYEDGSKEWSFPDDFGGIMDVSLGHTRKYNERLFGNGPSIIEVDLFLRQKEK